MVEQPLALVRLVSEARMTEELHIILPAISGDYVSERLRRLVRCLRAAGVDTDSHAGFLGGSDGYGAEFQNDVFEMHPEYDGDCTCGGEERGDVWYAAHPDRPASENPFVCVPTCPFVRPNFTCGAFTVEFHKYIGRSMKIDLAGMSEQEVNEMFDRCEASLAKPGETP